MSKLKLQWERYLYTDDTTIGRLYLINENYVNTSQEYKRFFSFTLEDTVRPPNIKVMFNTAIPAGVVYRVSKFENDHYGKTVILHTEDDGHTIKAGPLMWTYVLIHNGTNKEHTAGCLLVGRTLVDNKRISGGEKEELATLLWQHLNDGDEVTAEAINLDQLE